MASITKSDGTSSGDISKEAKAFGDYLRNLRKAKGLNQADLAKLVEITGGYYGFFEQGRQIPSLKIINRLAEVLDTDYVRMATLAGYDEVEASNKVTPRRRRDGIPYDGEHSEGDEDSADPRKVGTSQPDHIINAPGTYQEKAHVSEPAMENGRLDWAMMCIVHDPTYKLADQFKMGGLSNSVKTLVVQLYQAQTGRQLLTADESEKLNTVVHGSN